MADTRWRVDPDTAGARLDRFLASPDRLGSRGRALAALERGKVFLNGAEVGGADAARRLAEDDDVRVWADRPGSARVRARAPRHGGPHIVYEDAFLLVVNKPPGLLTVPLASADVLSLSDLLRVHLKTHRGQKPLVVHRIDRDTSGLVVFAKTSAAQEALKEQFVRREPERVYLAVVHGEPSPASGTWKDHLVWNRDRVRQHVGRAGAHGATEAVSRYRVLQVLRGAALVEVRLVTGKRNQIRIQAADRGFPLVGERKYTRQIDGDAIPFARQALHAWQLAFAHPADGRLVRFEAPIPEDFASLVSSLGGVVPKQH